jgi:hypothetical protein
LCHPDDLSNARGGRASDSFAHAKPVPVSEIAQRSFPDALGMLTEFRDELFSLTTATHRVLLIYDAPHSPL